MANSRPFKIDGVEIPQPNIDFDITPNIIHSADSGRDLSKADMHLKIVNTKLQYNFIYSMMPDELISDFLKQIDGKENFQLTFPSPIKGTDDTKTVYTGNMNIKHKMISNNVCYWDLNITFIEV